MRKILVANSFEFEKEIKRLNKKATKIGVQPIVYRQLGLKSVKRTYVEAYEGESREITVPMEVMEYEIDLPFVEHPQWELVGKIEPVEGSPRHFVDTYVPNIDKTEWEFSNFNCAHCLAKRHRSLMYIVRNKSVGGKLIQLGRNCFEDYIGKNTLAAFEFMAVVALAFGEGEEDFIFPRGFRNPESVPLKRAVCVAEALAEHHQGWINNGHDEFGNLTTEGTHRLARRFMCDPHAYMQSRKEIEAISNRQDIVDRVDAAVARISEMEGLDDFGQTLKYCAEFEYVPKKKLSLVAYLCQFLRNYDVIKEREARKAHMKHVGTVGKREVFGPLKCVRSHGFDGFYGTQWINVFNDASFNEYVWTTGQSFEVGQEVTLKATVKAHEHYNGTPQTIITRAKIV